MQQLINLIQTQFIYPHLLENVHKVCVYLYSFTIKPYKYYHNKWHTDAKRGKRKEVGRRRKEIFDMKNSGGERKTCLNNENAINIVWNVCRNIINSLIALHTFPYEKPMIMSLLMQKSIQKHTQKSV